MMERAFLNIVQKYSKNSNIVNKKKTFKMKYFLNVVYFSDSKLIIMLIRCSRNITQGLKPNVAIS